MNFSKPGISNGLLSTKRLHISLVTIEIIYIHINKKGDIDMQVKAGPSIILKANCTPYIFRLEVVRIGT